MTTRKEVETQQHDARTGAAINYVFVHVLDWKGGGGRGSVLLHFFMLKKREGVSCRPPQSLEGCIELQGNKTVFALCPRPPTAPAGEQHRVRLL